MREGDQARQRCYSGHYLVSRQGQKMPLKVNPIVMIVAAGIGALTMLQPASADAEQPCDIRALSDRTKAISKLAAFQDALNFLAVSQSVAIMEIETGQPVWPIHVRESSFFGPLVGLRKFTDKTENYLSNLDKEIRRLSSFDGFAARYQDIFRANTDLVAAGYDVLARLKDDGPEDARNILTTVTLPTLERVRAQIYTTVSELENSVALDAIRCR